MASLIWSYKSVSLTRQTCVEKVCAINGNVNYKSNCEHLKESKPNVDWKIARLTAEIRSQLAWPVSRRMPSCSLHRRRGRAYSKNVTTWNHWRCAEKQKCGGSFGNMCMRKHGWQGKWEWYKQSYCRGQKNILSSKVCLPIAQIAENCARCLELCFGVVAVHCPQINKWLEFCANVFCWLNHYIHLYQSLPCDIEGLVVCLSKTQYVYVRCLPCMVVL